MKHVLFVCGGNTCRSPMAGALAEHIVPGLRAETAGVAPGDQLAAHAATVIAERTGATPAVQEPLDLNETDPAVYDAVVAMDSFVADELIRWVPPALPLFVWQVPDPFGGTLADYRKSADIIEHLLRSTFLPSAEHASLAREHLELSPLSGLDAYLERARPRVGTVAPSHCNGIAAEAARRLERLLKSLLADRMAREGITVTEVLTALKRTGPAEVQKLPLGTVKDALGWLARRDEELRVAWSNGAGDDLGQFVKIRNDQIHAGDQRTIPEGTMRLLNLVEVVVGNEPFRKLLDTPPGTPAG